MFDLEKAIVEWRRGLTDREVANAATLDELESHLREDVEEQVRAGLSAEKAFEVAVQQMGEANALRSEFEKIGEVSDAGAWIHRLTMMERDIMLPIKAVVLPIFLYYFYASNWMRIFPGIEDSGMVLQRFLGFYLALNLLVAGVLVGSRRLPLVWVHRAAFVMSLADGLFLSLLCLLTGGCNSIVFWLLPGLIVRNTVSFPRPALQALLNFGLTVCYAATALFSVLLSRYPWDTEGRKFLEEAFPGGNATGQVFLSVLVLLLLAVSCSCGDFILTRQHGRLRTT